MNMLKLLWRFAILLVAAVSFAWLADRHEKITFITQNKEYQVSVLVGTVVLALFIFALWFLFSLFRKIWRSPVAARDYLRFRKTRKAYESLSRGIVAAGAGDAHAAAKHAGIAGETLKDEPLVRLLGAQAAQLRGDRAEVKRVFEGMAKNPETELLGLRGLFADAQQAGDWSAARTHAETAIKKNARLPWASTAVLQSHLAQRDWLAASQDIAQQVKAGLMPRGEGSRKQAALLCALAMEEEGANKPRSLELALEAHGLDAALVPAAVIVGRCYAANGNPRKAIKILKATWAQSPHPELASVMAHLHSDAAENQFERVRELVGKAPNDLEGALALARAAYGAARFDAAKALLENFTEDQPQQRVCGLMAEIEDALGDKGKSREWLARAFHAAKDPLWVSDGVAALRWTPISPVTSEIVTCEWKAPFELAVGGQLQFHSSTTAQPNATSPEPLSPQALPRPPDDPGVE
jgi:HemY protein